MILFRLSTLLSLAYSLPSLLASNAGNKMICGANVPYCGVLVLERGQGGGTYDHDQPSVHGLWPQNGKYGTSQCISSSSQSSPSDPTQEIPKASCYSDAAFQLHEWKAHGQCASSTPTFFFTQVCSLSAAPLSIMTEMKSKGAVLSEMAQELQQEGFPVYNPDAGKDQIMLSVCAGTDGVWKLAEVKKFSLICGY